MKKVQLQFKPHTKSEIPLRVKWLNDSQNNKYIGDNPGSKTTLKKQTEWFDKYKKDNCKKFFTIYHNTIPIGLVGFSNINKSSRVANIFIMIGENDYKRMGYGKEALNYLIDYGFNKLNLQKINLGVVEKNLPAVKLYKKLGFKIEGVFKREICIDGKFCTMLSMAKFA